METSSRLREKENPSLQTTSNTSSSCSNGVSTTSKTILRSETSIYPTTFVQADTSSFKKVVQMLTGSSETAKQASKSNGIIAKTPVPPMKTGPKKPAFKLYERRNSNKNFKISPLLPNFHKNFNGGFSPRNQEILSPSMLDFPSLVLSPVTPLIPDPFDRSPTAVHRPNSLAIQSEDRGYSDKEFYVLPSPRTPHDPEPRLLSLFPVTSPKFSG